MRVAVGGGSVYSHLTFSVRIGAVPPGLFRRTLAKISSANAMQLRPVLTVPYSQSCVRVSWQMGRMTSWTWHAPCPEMGQLSEPRIQSRDLSAWRVGQNGRESRLSWGQSGMNHSHLPF